MDVKKLISDFSIAEKIELYNCLYTDLSGKGIGGDTELAHVNPEEMAVLRAMGGAGTVTLIQILYNLLVVEEEVVSKHLLPLFKHRYNRVSSPLSLNLLLRTSLVRLKLFKNKDKKKVFKHFRVRCKLSLTLLRPELLKE